MAQHNFRPLSLNPEAYSRSFQWFLAATNQENSILKCIQKHIVPAIGKGICELLQSHLSGDTTFRILGVGSGEGENDINFLKVLVGNIPAVRGEDISMMSRVIEPDVGRLSTFRTEAENLPEHFNGRANVDFEWLPMTFQEYKSQKKADDVRFDVVHFIHSIYYLGVEDALVHCYEEELGIKGVLISISQAEDNPMLRFGEDFPGQRDSSLPRNKNVAAVAQQRGWKYFTCSGDTNKLDITTIFDSSSLEGGYLLDFLTNRMDVRQREEKETVEEFLKFWEKQSYLNEQGRRIVELRDNAVIILKGLGP